MTILTTNKLTISLAATFLFGIMSVVLASLPAMKMYHPDIAWLTGMFSAVAALLSCYFLVEHGRYRALLMVLAVAAFCFALPLLIVMLLA
jgi:hypothetical protein